MAEYEIFLRDNESIPLDQEVELEIRDRERLELLRVRAIVSRRSETDEVPDKLWILRGDQGGTREKTPFTITISARVDAREDQEYVPMGHRATYGKRRGFMLKSMIKEREKGSETSESKGV